VIFGKRCRVVVCAADDSPPFLALPFQSGVSRKFLIFTPLGIRGMNAVQRCFGTSYPFPLFQNVLLDSSWNPKICDFGMSRMTWADSSAGAQNQTKSDVGPIRWMSPYATIFVFLMISSLCGFAGAQPV
jgi:Protein tyrosine and serine/threonine kinase